MTFVTINAGRLVPRVLLKVPLLLYLHHRHHLRHLMSLQKPTAVVTLVEVGVLVDHHAMDAWTLMETTQYGQP